MSNKYTNNKDTNISRLKSSRAMFDWGSLSKPKIRTINLYSGTKIIDVGCSKGIYVKYLLEKGRDIYGCDILGDKNWEKIDAKRFKKADAYSLPYSNNSFDTAICFEVLEHLDMPEKALRELSRISSKNIIISVPNTENYPVFNKSGFTYYHYMDRTHVNFFTQKTIVKLLRANNFKVNYCKLINPVMPETFLLESWHFPIKFSSIIGKIFQRIPFTKKYYTDILIVASKV